MFDSGAATTTRRPRRNGRRRRNRSEERRELEVLVLVVRVVPVLIVGIALVVGVVSLVEGHDEGSVLEPIDDSVGGGAHGAGEAEGENAVGENEIHRGS